MKSSDRSVVNRAFNWTDGLCPQRGSPRKYLTCELRFYASVPREMLLGALSLSLPLSLVLPLSFAGFWQTSPKLWASESFLCICRAVRLRFTITLAFAIACSIQSNYQIVCCFAKNQNVALNCWSNLLTTCATFVCTLKNFCDGPLMVMIDRLIVFQLHLLQIWLKYN